MHKVQFTVCSFQGSKEDKISEKKSKIESVQTHNASNWRYKWKNWYTNDIPPNCSLPSSSLLSRPYAIAKWCSGLPSCETRAASFPRHDCKKSCRSATELIFCLIHDIEVAFSKGGVATLLTLDISGTFVFIINNRLILRLREQRCPLPL